MGGCEGFDGELGVDAAGDGLEDAGGKIMLAELQLRGPKRGWMVGVVL